MGLIGVVGNNFLLLGKLLPTSEGTFRGTVAGRETKEVKSCSISVTSTCKQSQRMSGKVFAMILPSGAGSGSDWHLI
jgi:hypothetical protein